jgi:hypothetical protein
MIPITKPIEVVQTTLNLNSFWLSSLNIQSANPNTPSRLVAVVEKVQANEDGTFVRGNNVAGSRGVLQINNLEADVAKDAQTLTFKSPVTSADITLYTADIMLAVTLKVKQMAETKNVI